ncbi:MAG: hypothetical protein KC425_07655 [Anaerolineales bacterium]|nr:hypothetical protein [Anaerolineales bacterium]
MQLVTTILVQAAAWHVWHVLTTPQLTGDCLPGLLRWETLEPERRFALLVAWGESSGSSGLQVPAVVEWSDLAPPQRLTVSIQVRLGSGLVTGSALVQLCARAAAETAVEINADVHTANALLQPIVHNAAGRLLPPLLRCLRAHAEARHTQGQPPLQ